MPGKTRAIVATSIGNMLEWYDFTVYALFAGYIAGNFFPGDDPKTRLLKTFLLFGLGFVVRPLGAVLIGNFGDRAGRKAALTLTILLMAAGTGIIAFSPTYATLGIGAPLLLLLGRVLQGFSAGGEIGGATAYLLESADLAQRGRVASWLEASMGMANIAGALVAFSVTTLLSPAELQSWGWRIPFILGLVIAPVGLYLRRSLDETDAFQAETLRRARDHTADRAPLLEIFRLHGSTLFVGFCVAILWAVAAYDLMIFLPTYVQRPDTFNFTAPQAFGASLLSNIPFVIGCVWFGSQSDRIGRRRSLFLSALLLFVLVLPLFLWLKSSPTLATLIAVQCIVSILVASFVGVAPAALSEIFPTGVRSTGTSLVYNGAFTLFGGFAPMILTWLTQRSGGSIYSPAWYVMLAAVVAMIAIPFLGARTVRDSGAAKAAVMVSLLGVCSLMVSDRSYGAIDPSEWHSATIHGHKIYYAMRGDGPSLVLLHGGGDSGEHSFARQIDAFAENHRIVAPDQVGQGRTPDIAGPLTYTGMMDDTAALLAKLKLRHVDVVGFSDGGILALMLAIRHPELVRRLVISGVNIAPEGLNPDDLEDLRATQNPKPKTIDEKLANLWLTSPTEAELSVSMLAKIEQPVLVVSGDRDAITLEHTLKIFHALPDAELCVLPGTDHATFSSRPEWLNPIINAFLSRAIK